MARCCSKSVMATVSLPVVSVGMSAMLLSVGSLALGGASIQHWTGHRKILTMEYLPGETVREFVRVAPRNVTRPVGTLQCFVGIRNTGCQCRSYSQERRLELS